MMWKPSESRHFDLSKQSRGALKEESTFVVEMIYEVHGNA